MLIFSWNCRGIGNDSTIFSLKAFLRATKADIIFISEIKSSLVKSVKTIRSMGFQNYCINPAVGKSGGLWALWKSEVYINIESTSKNLIHLTVQASQTTPEQQLLCIYGPPNQQNRPLFWSTITQITNSIVCPFVCIGDFNSIKNQNEKRGGNTFDANSTKHFQDWITGFNMIDLGYFGPTYTWENRRNNGENVSERLDRPYALQTGIYSSIRQVSTTC